MRFRFELERGLIVIPVMMKSRRGEAFVNLALDTGATRTMINTDIAVLLGYDPAVSPDRIQIVTGSGVEYAPRITVHRVAALGIAREDFSVLCHTLPASAAVDGLPGLDFFKDSSITIDLRTNILYVNE